MFSPHSRPVRIGVVGCGNVLSAYRTPLEQLSRRGLAVVTLACGRDRQRADVAASLPGARFVTESAEVIDAPDVDVVLILTSMPQHAPLAIAALRKGKHVVVEKPFATNLAEARDLLDCARNSARRLVCAPFTTLSPTFQILARRLRAGDIGRPCSARARYGWAGPWWNAWFYRDGGGALFDLGVYCLTTLTGLLGPARRVTAFAGTAIPQREIDGRPLRVEVEDNAQVLLDFGASTFGVVTTGFTLQQYRGPALEIYGTTGTLQMLGDDWDPEGYELWQNAAGCWQSFKESAPEWSWTDGLRHAVECLHADRAPQVEPQHAYHVLEVMLAAREAARTGCAQEIRSSFDPIRLDGETDGAEPAHLVHDRTR